MIDRDTLDSIRQLKKKYKDAYDMARGCGFGDRLASSLAYDKVGAEAMEAINLLLAEVDRKEDDLK